MIKNIFIRSLLIAAASIFLVVFALLTTYRFDMTNNAALAVTNPSSDPQNKENRDMLINLGKLQGYDYEELNYKLIDGGYEPLTAADNYPEIGSYDGYQIKYVSPYTITWDDKGTPTPHPKTYSVTRPDGTIVQVAAETPQKAVDQVNQPPAQTQQQAAPVDQSANQAVAATSDYTKVTNGTPCPSKEEYSKQCDGVVKGNVVICIAGYWVSKPCANPCGFVAGAILDCMPCYVGCFPAGTKTYSNGVVGEDYTAGNCPNGPTGKQVLTPCPFGCTQSNDGAKCDDQPPAPTQQQAVPAANQASQDSARKCTADQEAQTKCDKDKGVVLECRNGTWYTLKDNCTNGCNAKGDDCADSSTAQSKTGQAEKNPKADAASQTVVDACVDPDGAKGSYTCAAQGKISQCQINPAAINRAVSDPVMNLYDWHEYDCKKMTGADAIKFCAACASKSAATPTDKTSASASDCSNPAGPRNGYACLDQSGKLGQCQIDPASPKSSKWHSYDCKKVTGKEAKDFCASKNQCGAGPVLTVQSAKTACNEGERRCDPNSAGYVDNCIAVDTGRQFSNSGLCGAPGNSKEIEDFCATNANYMCSGTAKPSVPAAAPAKGCQSCYNPGQVTCGIKSDNTNNPGYLQVCQKEGYCLSQSFQCGLDSTQQQKLKDIFNIDNQFLKTANQPQYQSPDLDPSVKAQRKIFETQVIDNIINSKNQDILRLLCQNFNYATTRCGCDPELNPAYNNIKCTDVLSEATDASLANKIGDCLPCSPGQNGKTSYGCGGDLTKKQADGLYGYSICKANPASTSNPDAPSGCWESTQICKPGAASACDQFCKTPAKGTLPLIQWDGGK